MLFDTTVRAFCKVLYARVEFLKKNYTGALVIRFLRKMERWNKLSCHCLSSLHCGRKIPEGQLHVLKYLGALFNTFVYYEVALLRVAVVCKRLRQ